MKSPHTRRSACITIALLFALTLGNGGRRALAQDSQPTETEKLVSDLGADDFKKRDDAQRKLEAMGKKALPALEAAEKDSKDAEVRARAHEAIQSIRKGGPSGSAPDTERQGVPRNETPPPFKPFPRLNPAPNNNGGEDEGAEIDEFFKLFEKGGNPMQGGDLGKIFEQLRKQLEGLDQEFEKEPKRPNGQPGRGKTRVYEFGTRAKTSVEDKLGVALGSPSPAVRAQLDLGPTDAGLSVDELVAGSPGWKAGLKLYDVVTTLDGKPVRTPNDLAGLGEKESKLEVIRKSKKETLLVHKAGETPAETPAPAPKKTEEPVRKF